MRRTLELGNIQTFPAGFGSGVSYDCAARIFRQGGAGGSIQFLFDLTAMESLYGAGSPSLGRGWNPTSSARIGAIDLGDTSDLNLSIYNSNDSFVNASTVVIGPISPIPVPEPSTSVLGVIAINALAFAARRCTRRGHVVH